MIIIDYSAISLATIVVQKLEIDENLIRHMILNSIRMYNQKFGKEYGQVVIACDASTWRREYFPQYKFKRREGRKESDTDWDEIFRIINMVKDEIKEHMPYKVIKVDGCEADDIIGTLALSTQEFGKDEPVMIISSDKDFIQLQRFKNVKQYSPSQKKMVTDANPVKYLFEHIIKGDSGDGVPNILSSDDVFVEGNRQSPVSKKKLEEWYNNKNNLESVLGTTELKNYARNQKLIDLTNTPDDLQEKIMSEYNEQENKPNSKVLNYLITKRCRQLIECIEEFYPYVNNS